MKLKCPICGRSFSDDLPGAALPFCSMRCKMIDAKRWLNEEYSVTRINKEKLEEEIAEWEQAAAVNPEDN
ncbi:MAG: DNA gyrase inhibitor YacG [Planctomycetia bacterium]|nr:DNA gyrase inhibitor YacG [Planctomycetia bacterium]